MRPLAPAPERGAVPAFPGPAPVVESVTGLSPVEAVGFEDAAPLEGLRAWTGRLTGYRPRGRLFHDPRNGIRVRFRSPAIVYAGDHGPILVLHTARDPDSVLACRDYHARSGLLHSVGTTVVESLLT